MDTFRGRAPRHLAAVRQFRAGAQIRACRTRIGLIDGASIKRARLTAKENCMGKREGKIALVTGGNSGIGLATAKQFVSEGSYVVFANAGVAKYAAFGKITEEHYYSIFNINVKGLLFTVQKALPLLADG